MGFPCMSLVASPLLLLIFFLCVWSLLVWSVCVLACLFLGLYCMGLFGLLGCDWLFPFPCWSYFQLKSFKIFLIPFRFLFFFWDPYNSNAGAFDIVPRVSETIFSYFHSFYFILLFRIYFHHFIFQLTDSFFSFKYSAMDSL